MNAIASDDTEASPDRARDSRMKSDAAPRAWRAWEWLVAGLCAVGLLRAGASLAGSLFWPFGRDQGVFAWVGDVILHGGAPYADAWEQKGPATHYLFAGLQALFGRSMWAVRGFDALAVVCVAGLFFRLLHRRAGAVGAAVATALFVGLHYRLGFWSTAQPDAWGGMAAGAALLLLDSLAMAQARAGKSGLQRDSGAGRSQRRWAGWIAGALLGIALMFKLTFLVIWVPVAVHFLVERAPLGGRLRRAVWNSWRTLAGASAVVLLFVGLLAAVGGLGDYLEIQFRFNPSVHQSAHGRGISEHAWALWKLLEERGLQVPLLLALVTLPLSLREGRRLVLTMGAAVFVGLCAIVLQDKYYDYHAAPLFVPVAVLTGLGVGRAAHRVRDAGGAVWARAAVFGLLWVGLLSVRSNWNLDGWRAFVLGTFEPGEYYEQFGAEEGEFYLPANLEVVRYLAGKSSPEDRVLVFGFAPMIPFLADRRTATRFGFRYPLTAGRGIERVERYRAEFLLEMREQLPTYVVIGEHDQNNLFPLSSREESMSIGLDALLESSYRLEAEIAGFLLYRRR